ncbi:ash family protein [Vibrio fluvialis]|nr:ash family protein [Vibrio fluvialis]MBY7938613.1 ash family protein [Vibrio fluvialis]
MIVAVQTSICVLTSKPHLNYSNDSLAKSNDGIGLPQFSKAHSRQLLAGFFYAHDSAHPNYGGLGGSASARRPLER